MQETKTKKNNAQPVNKEAFRMLATEIGLNAACRKLGVPIPTGKSWARRGKWNLPKRKGGRPERALTASNASSLHPIADALAQTHKELEEQGKTAIAQAAVKSAKQHGTLPLPDAQALSQLANALGRVFQWSNGAGNTVNVHADKAVIVVDESRRAELITQRQRLLAEKPATGHTIETAAPAPLPKEQTQASENVGARNGTATQDQEPTVQQAQDPFYRHMQAIGRGESWKEPAAYSGSFGPWPIEEEFR